MLLNLILAAALKFRSSSVVSQLANWSKFGTSELTVRLTSAMVGATTVVAAASPARQTRMLLDGFSTEPFRCSKWWKVVTLPSLTPMKARPPLLARRSVQSCPLEGKIFPRITVRTVGDVV